MSVATTRDVRVEVESHYDPDRSSPEEQQYLFVYTVTISNLGSETVQLLSRHWIITDSDGNVEEVKGPGVVGEQPVLKPGDSFSYTSFCPLKTAVGAMHGTYQMRTSAGETFAAEIAPFGLEVPNVVN